MGCLGFVMCYLWCTWKLILGSDLLDDYFEHNARWVAGIIGDDTIIEEESSEKGDTDTAVVSSSVGTPSGNEKKRKGKGSKKR